MGAGASSGLAEAIGKASVGDVQAILAGLSETDLAKLNAAVDPIFPSPVECIPCLVTHELKGEWLAGVEEETKVMYQGFEEMGDMNMNPRNIDTFRQGFNSNPETGEPKEYDRMDLVPYLEKVDTELIKIDATVYGGSKKEMAMYVHKVKGAEDKDRPAFIYFHGGAFVFGSGKRAQPESAKHAVKFNVTTFSVDYGVAPEVKAPDSALNCYAAVKYVTENYAKFSLDVKKIAIGGESAGGCHTAMCCYQLAKRNEASAVKFAWMDIAPSSNHWFDRTKENSRTWLEHMSAEGQFGPLECMCKTDTPFDEKASAKEFSRRIAGEHKNDPEIFPALMGDDLAKRCPPTYITSREFDDYRRDNEEYAELMKKNKRLLMEPYFQPGATHMSGMHEEAAGVKECDEAFETFFNHFMSQ